VTCRCVAIGAAIVVAVCLGPEAAVAQIREAGAQRPVRGLFGGADRASTPRQLFAVSLSLSEGYNSDTLPEARSLVDPTASEGDGFFTRVQGGLEYQWQRPRVAVGASSWSAARYDAHDGRIRTLGHTAGIGLSAQVAKGTRLFANQEVAYSPAYMYTLFAQFVELSEGQAAPPAWDYRISSVDSLLYRTTASIEQRFGARNRVNATADLSYTDFPDDSDRWQDLSSRAVGLTFSRNFAPDTALGAGYRYQTGRLGYGVNTTASEHGVDLSLSHGRRLSADRRLSIGATLGTSMTEAPELVAAGDPDARLGRITGGATLGYDLGRSWQARATFRRGVEFLAGLSEPVSTRGVTAALTGFVTPRLDVAAQAGVSDGESALRYGRTAFDTQTASARARFALSRTLAAEAEYVFYRYDFGAGPILAEGLPPRMTRHAARVGITLWAPLVRK
jgi:hypothetical protein